MGLDASVLRNRRVLAFAALAALVVAWYELAPQLPYAGKGGSVAIACAGVIPGVLALVFLALPVWERGWVFPLAIVATAAAVVFSVLDLHIEANFAKFAAAILVGWSFLRVFEELSWIVIVACLIPIVDALSVWQGPTHTLTQPQNIHIYYSVAIAFVVPGGSAAQLGPPDIIFYGVFLAAALRWRLRVRWTWLAMTAMYAAALAITYEVSVNGLPALPFLSFGFLVVNADLLWRRLRPQRS